MPKKNLIHILRKETIKIVILNLYRLLSCLSHGDASIHLINAIFWANFNFEKQYIDNIS